jgi:hypothetical protein
MIDKRKYTVVLAFCVLLVSMTNAWKQKAKEPNEEWLNEREVRTFPKGFVRSEEHAKAIGRQAIYYIAYTNDPVKAKRIGPYWIVYNPVKRGAKSSSYFVQISVENGAIVCYGLHDFD